MNNPFATKKPAPGAPTKTRLEFPGEIRDMIRSGSKLFSIKQLPAGYEFDYRIWIDAYDETHVNALIHGGGVKLGSLIEDSNGYLKFERSTIYAADLEDDTAELASFAANQFDAVWTSVDVACRAPIQLGVYVYD